MVDVTPISDYQAAWDRNRPLASLRAAAIDDALVAIARAIAVEDPQREGSSISETDAPDQAVPSPQQPAQENGGSAPVQAPTPPVATGNDPGVPRGQRLVVRFRDVAAGALVLGSAFDALVNAIELLTPLYAAVGTGLIVLFWLVASIWLHIRPMTWITDSGRLELDHLSKQIGLGLVGAVVLLWMPSLVQNLKEKTELTAPPVIEGGSTDTKDHGEKPGLPEPAEVQTCEVTLVLPADMEDAEVLVGGQPVAPIARTPITATILVPRDQPLEISVRNKDARVCTAGTRFYRQEKIKLPMCE